jgi:hypothetical protein
MNCHAVVLLHVVGLTGICGQYLIGSRDCFTDSNCYPPAFYFNVASSLYAGGGLDAALGPGARRTAAATISTVNTQYTSVAANTTAASATVRAAAAAAAAAVQQPRRQQQASHTASVVVPATPTTAQSAPVLQRPIAQHAAAALPAQASITGSTAFDRAAANHALQQQQQHQHQQQQQQVFVNSSLPAAASSSDMYPLSSWLPAAAVAAANTDFTAAAAAADEENEWEYHSDDGVHSSGSSEGNWSPCASPSRSCSDSTQKVLWGVRMPATATTAAVSASATGRKRTAMLPSNVLMSRLVEFAQQQQQQQQQEQHGVAKGKGKGRASSSGSKRKASGSVTQRQRKVPAS